MPDIDIFGANNPNTWSDQQKRWDQGANDSFARGTKIGEGISDYIKKSKTEAASNDIVSQLQGKTPIEQRDIITSHPGWSASPITAPIIDRIFKTQSSQMEMARDAAMNDAMVQAKTGETVLANKISEGARNGNWTDPSFQSDIYKIGAQYPSLMQTKAWAQTIGQFGASAKAEAKANELSSKNDISEQSLAMKQLQLEKAKDTRTTPEKLLDAADKADDEAASAKGRGDEPAYEKSLKRAASLREAISEHGSEATVIGWDDNNNPQVSITKGVGSSGKTPTIATQTLAQENIAKYDNAIDLGSTLLKNLQDSDVGVQGVVGNVIGDRLLGDMFPGMSSKSRIDARQAIDVFRNSALRAVADDRSGRFTGKDREDIEAALPSSGMIESGVDAKEKIKGVLKIFKSRGREYSERTGTPLSDKLKNSVEIRTDYQKQQKALDNAVKRGAITQAQAQSELATAQKKSIGLLQNLDDDE